MTIRYVSITSRGSHGYHCVYHSDGLSPSDVALLERTALPYGSNWGSFIGARSIKVFPIASERTAISYIRVVDSADDHGRRGILECQCALITTGQLIRLLKLPDFSFDTIINKPDALYSILGGHGPVNDPLPDIQPKPGILPRHTSLLKLLAGRKVILKREYRGPEDWRSVEHSIRTFVLGLPSALIRYASFATLTLSEADDMRIIAVPR